MYPPQGGPPPGHDDRPHEEENTDQGDKDGKIRYIVRFCKYTTLNMILFSDKRDDSGPEKKEGE